MKVLFSALVTFVMGALSSDFTRSAIILFRGDVQHECLGGVCIGDSEASLRLLDMDNVGGLDSIICGPKPDKNTGYLFFPEFLTMKCPLNTYDMHFNDGLQDTRIEVIEGKISNIFRGPLHIIDF